MIHDVLISPENKMDGRCGQRHEHVGLRTRWMDDVDRDMNIVLENKMDGRCGQRHEHCGTENNRWMDDVDRDMNIVGRVDRDMSSGWMDDVDRDMNIVGLRTRWSTMWTET